jgi:hypothetical protein
MGLSHKNDIALAGVSHLDGIAKAGLSHIGGQLIGSAAAGYLFTENFEATGFDTAGWAKLGTGTINEDYSTAGLGMEGSQCLRIQAVTSQTPNLTWGTFTPSGEVWFYMLYRLVSITTSSVVFLTIRDSAGLTVRVRMGSTGLFGLLTLGVAVVNATVAINPNTTYHVWVHYKKGTGTNAIARMAWSTDGIKPTSGSQFIEILTGTSLVNVDRIAIGNSVAHGKEYIMDKMRISATEIGDNPT